MEKLRELLNTIDRYQTVPLAKDAGTLASEWSKLTDEVVAFMAWHGYKQLLGDTGASLKDKAEIVAAANKKRDSLLAGEIRTQAERAVDDETRIARQALMRVVQDEWKAQGKRLGKHYEAKDLSAEVVKRLADPLYAEYIAFAKAQVAAEVALRAKIVIPTVSAPTT